jgi:hypothetical protein
MLRLADVRLPASGSSCPAMGGKHPSEDGRVGATPARRPLLQAPGSRSLRNVCGPKAAHEAFRRSRAAISPNKKPPYAAAFQEPSAGLEPATPSLPWRSGHVAAASANGQSRCTSRESGCRSTRQPPARFDILRYPLGTRAWTAHRTQARTFGRSPWPTARSRHRDVEIITPKLRPRRPNHFHPAREAPPRRLTPIRIGERR